MASVVRGILVAAAALVVVSGPGEAAKAGRAQVTLLPPKAEAAPAPAKSSALPRGISTWVYSYRPGVARQIRRFNAQARPELRFRYLFPYGGSPSFDRVARRVTMHYRPDATRAYAKALPRDMLLFAIVDGRNDDGAFDGWTDAQYREAAQQVADCIIADPYAAGVQIDIEPFHPAHIPFYRYLRQMLNAKGKYSTMFIGPWDKGTLTRVFHSCDIVVMSGYDLAGEGEPVATYRERLQAGVARFQEVAEETGGHYLIGIPAAASWGEYEYVAGGEGGRRESGVKQEEYVRAALEVVKPYQRYPQYLGTALWRISDPETEFEEPGKAAGPTKFPNVIRPGIWKMLERY